MISRSQAIEYYRQAKRRGERYYHACAARGEYPYPRVLEDVLDTSMDSGNRVGLIDIPMERIVGTRAAGRKNAFAGNFMPLLNEDTEFAQKWIALCEAHMSDEGIHDPIIAIEFMGMFYVQEGHKRVSVLRFFDSPSVTAQVTRVLPPWSDSQEVRVYYEFLDFYKVSKLYQVTFRRPGDYARLVKALGFAPDHVWTDDERGDFVSLYNHFREAAGGSFNAAGSGASPEEAMLACLELYSYDELRCLDKAELQKRMRGLRADLSYVAQDEPSAVSTQPEIVPEKSVLGKLIDGITRPVLNVAFIYASDPEKSNWSHGHDMGRADVEKALGDRVRVKTYTVGEQSAEAVMQEAVKDGAQLLFATAPTLLEEARKIAAANPQLKVLVCALSVPHAGIRTYYARTYEARFISGALAGALCGGQPIGCIERSPILGIPAAVNAFALGARMTAPDSDVHLEWSSVAGNPVERLREAGVRIVSGPELGTQDAADGTSWSTSLLLKNGGERPIVSALWNWGKLYEHLVRSVLSGGWEASEKYRGSAVNYWWGMNSGVIDVRLSEDLPAGIVQLADILKRGLCDGSIQPFRCRMLDQEGNVRNEVDSWLPPEEIMRMNWLCDNVIGSIPQADELMAMSRETTQLLSLDREAGKEKK